MFNVPKKLVETLTIRPVLVAISNSQSKDIFVAELEDNEQADKLARAFMLRGPGNSLSAGILVKHGAFRGFESLEAEQQLSRLETQYKEYDTVRLGDIVNEINIVRSGQNHEEKANAVYIPMLGSSTITYDINQVSIKHHNIFQVVLSEKYSNEYVSAFFKFGLNGQGQPRAENFEEIRNDLFEKRKIINDYRDRMAAHVDLKNPAYQPEWTEVKIYIDHLEEVISKLYFLSTYRSYGHPLGGAGIKSKETIEWFCRGLSL